MTCRSCFHSFRESTLLQNGAKFKLNDAESWWPAEQDLQVESDRLGRVRLQWWSSFHFYQSPAHPMHLIRVEPLTAERNHQPFWLLWTGQTFPELNGLWHQYLRRFTIDHWYRLLKQRLHWTLPRFATPELGLLWSDLMPILSWQLWFARSLVLQASLPWQKLLLVPSPGRVADSFATLLVRLDSPAPDPKPCGKPPRWLTGRVRARRIRYPTVRKGFKKPKTPEIKSA